MMKCVGKYLFLSLIFLIISAPCKAQVRQIMGFNDYMEIVKMYHPVAAQARLNPEYGEASVTAARGGFDPQAYTNINQKYFNDDQYYSLIDAGLQIPTWFGIEVYSGWERNDGVNLNPERSTPELGLFYAGVSLPIGRNLFIDKRRADLRNAQLFEKISFEEQKLMLNDVLVEASNTYWDWYAAYHRMEVFEESVELAEDRLNMVRENALQGDAPIIDTVEAFIQLQNRQLGLQEAELNYKNQTERLSVFLWSEGFVPLEITDEIIPEDRRILAEYILDEAVTNDIEKLINEHPIIKQNEFYLDQLDIERRMRIEQLKPVINLKYNAINEPIGGDIISGYSINNYTWGVEFYMPLFLRRGRGELKIAKLRIRDAELDLENTIASIKMRVNQSLNNWQISTNQVELTESTVDNLEILLEGERTKFFAGESSLFLVNAREVSYIDEQVKLINLISKNQKSLLEISYQLGILDEY